MRDPEPSIRLNRYLAMVGLGSRRWCDELVRRGEVEVDGARVRSPALRVVPGVNSVAVGGRRLERQRGRVVLLLNKPVGVVSTARDPEGRKTVVDLCRPLARGRRIFPIGRLDINTTGAILLTDDGLLCFRLSHPSFALPRTYRVVVEGKVDERKLKGMVRLAWSGRLTSEKRATPKKPQVRLLAGRGRKRVLEVILYEGRNRQVRRLCAQVGLGVVKLTRICFGPVSIRGLPPGGVRLLSNRELAKLERATRLV